MKHPQSMANLRASHGSATEIQRDRRHIIKDFVERNYGVPFTRTDVVNYLRNSGFATSSPPSVDRDFQALGIQLITAHVGGQKIRFYAQLSHVPEYGADNLREHVSAKTIENEMFKELFRAAMDVFTDGKRVVITTAYERAKHLALWIKNLSWPEIWYLSKEDGSVIVIETVSEARAEFLKKRFWGVRSDNEPVNEEEEENDD